MREIEVDIVNTETQASGRLYYDIGKGGHIALLPEDPLHLGTLVFLSKKDFEECAANASLIDDLETNWNVLEAYVVGNGKAGLKCTIVVLAVSASGQSADSRVNVICDHLEAINREGGNIVTARFYGMGRTLQISYIGQRKIGH